MSSLPAPIYRHAAPSGPWPWVDFDTDFLSTTSEISIIHDGGSTVWSGYPQTHFGNWTSIPVERSKMLTQCAQKGPCVVYGIDVMDNGQFKIPHEQGLDRFEVSQEKEEEFWSKLNDKVENVRVRALFVDNLTAPVLKMLGTRYNIEPFFFSSSTNWIPSRYQEEVQHGKGDHITVTLPFIRTMGKEKHITPPCSPLGRKSTIDVLAPLHLHGEHVLLIDLLAIHMIRATYSSTIITYHPSLPGRTTAKRLHQVMARAGRSVYWNKIFEASGDPTFFFLAILWYALYAWDEAFEVLYLRIKHLEGILNDSDLAHTADLNHKLHSLQAHLLHYQTLLHDFEKSVAFVRDTPNPAIKSSDDRNTTNQLMQRECKNLLSEINRLQRKCLMFINRLKNATELAFATVNIEDTQASLRDSAAMKQISYLTMVFLPASFTASIFGMNVAEINPGSLETVARYVEVTLLLTFVTTWVVIAFQPYSSIHKSGDGVWQRAAWPVFFFRRKFARYYRQNSSRENNPSWRPSRRRDQSSTMRFEDAV
ncbi:uncharacterized protein EDB91DRAFT_1125494 [Suillus paluster]|uniref:uncharacterized protein n=1 Tax=Suillus paluster TaxID=48578 RepID=UPI001B87566A|nr:uncharacterized protein EDB91DRAFT_1125494 [Suillus paluster]KAG1743701.1 hypothetical protein EDB91DRAFT_1125494 [Suillus paluster]